MNQLDLTFFWPLTEQIPLDLKYDGCDTRVSLVVPLGVGITNITGASPAYITTSQHLSVADVSSKGITIDSGTLTIKGRPMPWWRKVMFKIMGFEYA